MNTSFQQNWLLAIGLAFFGYLIVRLLQVGKRPSNLPPGPPTLPLIGNLHLMPSRRAYEQFTEWGKRHGPIYSLMIGSMPMIVLQSHQSAKELLDSRGANYSSRPSMYIFSNLASRSMRGLVMKYNPTLRQIHRVNHKLLNATSATTYEAYQVLESRQMLLDMSNTPEDHSKHVQRYAIAVACQIVYGLRPPTISDPRIQRAHRIAKDTTDLAASVPAQMMDAYPILQQLPTWLIPVCRQALDIDRRFMAMFMDRWLEEKAKVQNSSDISCFCTSLVEAQAKEGFSDEQAAYMAGDIVEAASGTITDELSGFLMAMVTHREVQVQAHKELDSVVGFERLPTFDDMASLPYIRGCVKETLRWMPTSGLLVPHAPLKDDTYEGYRIPAGATVMLNVWALNMDPDTWPNPRTFDPFRFKDEERSEHEIATSSDAKGPRHNYAFGAGRRLCQGIHVAERSLFLAMACLLWAFDISTPDPGAIDTDDLRGGMAMAPAPFECRLKLRDGWREKVLREEWSQQRNDSLDPNTEQWVRGA